jgi:hypothetical protein
VPQQLSQSLLCVTKDCICSRERPCEPMLGRDLYWVSTRLKHDMLSMDHERNSRMVGEEVGRLSSATVSRRWC